MTNPQDSLTNQVMEIICRQAGSSFDAVATAQGMENAGANVFSIAFYSGMNPMFSFSVFAKYDRELVTPTAISVQKYRTIVND